MVLFSTIFLLSIIIFAVFADFIAPSKPGEYNLSERFQPPSLKHIFGTDNFGRDIFSHIVYGARITLFVCFLSTLIAAIIGVPAGLVSGFFGGFIDSIIMRIVDIMFSFPPLLLAISMVAFLGPSTINVVLAIGVVGSASVARITRGQVLQCREMEFIEAARNIGCKNSRILIFHILPNVLAPIIVVLTLRTAFAILTEAALSFVGLGVPPPTPSWGRLISTARDYVTTAPWMFIVPGLAIMLTTLSFNFLGDGLRDFLDPRLK